MSNDDCRARQLSGSLGMISDSVLCAQGQARGLCNRDTGGALFIRGELAGIVAWAKPWHGPWCVSGVPDVYTRVSSFVNWIQNLTSTEWRISTNSLITFD